MQIGRQRCFLMIPFEDDSQFTHAVADQIISKTIIQKRIENRRTKIIHKVYSL